MEAYKLKIEKASLEKTTKIYIAGHKGMVGSSILRALSKKGYTNLVTASSKELDLKNQILNSLQKLENIKLQLATTDQVVINYQRLLLGERKKFEIGESSVFMVNKRESSLLKSQIKAIQLKEKLQVSYVDLLYKLGILYQI